MGYDGVLTVYMVHFNDQNNQLVKLQCTMLGFTNRGGMQTSISVPVHSKFGCELQWGVAQLGQDHGAPPAPCRGAQGCTGAHFPQLFCLLS